MHSRTKSKRGTIAKVQEATHRQKHSFRWIHILASGNDIQSSTSANTLAQASSWQQPLHQQCDDQMTPKIECHQHIDGSQCMCIPKISINGVVKSVKRIGPRTLPCGTPTFNGYKVELFPFTLTQNLLSIRTMSDRTHWRAKTSYISSDLVRWIREGHD